MQPSDPSSGFNPDQNPFEALIAAGAKGQSAPPQMPDPSQGGQAPATPPTPQVGPDGMPLNDATQPGKTGDSTRPLLGAISQLHQFIAMSTDPQEIQMIRQVVSMLTNLIQKDQQRSSQMMQQQQGGQQ
jgi:hypothetical protein